ncbi:SDR family oxidoreductase [Knoellia sp. CPCC 206435]|uniref:SDR family oxidoreductase n=1 Tax=Knoellia terrae TaxID=3404797 RepID=UPI003B43B0E2
MNPQLTTLVCGGDRHLGSIVAALTAIGARVLLQAQDEQELEAAHRLAGSGGGRVEVLDAAVGSFQDADDLVARVVRVHGGLDVLLAPPVPTSSDRLVDLGDEAWHALLASYQKRAVALARAAARRFVEQGRGGRILTFSHSGTFASLAPASAAMNAAMLSLASAIATSLAEHRVTANCLVLGDDVIVGEPTGSDRNMVSELVAHLCTPAAEGISGRFLFASEHDLGMYSAPMAIANPHALVRFAEDAPADAVSQFLTPLLDIGTT